MPQPHVTSFGTVMVAAFFAADLVSMRITDCLAVEEEPGGRSITVRLVAAGLAVPRVPSLGGEPTHSGPRPLACWSAIASPRVRKSRCFVMAGGRLLTDGGLVSPTDAPAASSSSSFAESWAAS